MGVETLVGNCIIKCSLFFLSFFFFFKLVLQYLCSKVPNKALLFCVIRSLSKICVWKEIGKKSDIIIIIIYFHVSIHSLPYFIFHLFRCFCLLHHTIMTCALFYTEQKGNFVWYPDRVITPGGYITV